MFRLTAVILLMLSFSQPCRAETYGEAWNVSGIGERIGYIYGWLDATRDMCGQRTDGVCGAVKGYVDIEAMANIISTVYEIPLYGETPYNVISKLSLLYLKGKLSTWDFASRLAAASQGRTQYAAPSQKPARRQMKPAPKPPGLQNRGPEAAAGQGRMPAAWRNF